MLENFLFMSIGAAAYKFGEFVTDRFTVKRYRWKCPDCSFRVATDDDEVIAAVLKLHDHPEMMETDK